MEVAESQFQHIHWACKRLFSRFDQNDYNSAVSPQKMILVWMSASFTPKIARPTNYSGLKKNRKKKVNLKTLKEGRNISVSCLCMRRKLLWSFFDSYLSPFNPPLLKDPFNERPLTDYYPITRAANGPLLPACPQFISVWSICLSLYDRLLSVCMDRYECAFAEPHENTEVSAFTDE